MIGQAESWWDGDGTNDRLQHPERVAGAVHADPTLGVNPRSGLTAPRASVRQMVAKSAVAWATHNAGRIEALSRTAGGEIKTPRPGNLRCLMGSSGFDGVLAVKATSELNVSHQGRP